MPWMPLNDDDPLKVASDEWFETLPAHIKNAAISLAIKQELSPVALLAKLAIAHQLSLTKASLSDLADILGISHDKRR